MKTKMQTHLQVTDGLAGVFFDVADGRIEKCVHKVLHQRVDFLVEVKLKIFLQNFQRICAVCLHRLDLSLSQSVEHVCG